MDNGSGVKYPKLSIGGKAYELRLSMGAFYRLEEQGLPADAIAAEIERWLPVTQIEADGAVTTIKPGRVSVAILFKLLSACIGSQTTLTPEQLADLMDMSDMPEVAAAVGEACAIAMSKMAPPAEIKLQEPAAGQGLQ